MYLQLCPLSKVIDPSNFDTVYGSSSGALNAIYFVTKESDVGLSIYSENATDKMCTNIWNFPNVLNVDWLVDEWIFDKKSFNYENLSKSPTSVIFSLTNIANGEADYFSAKGVDKQKLNQAMKATSYAPLLTNATQTIDGITYNDGAVADAIPLERAILDGCTHIVCLLTRNIEYRKGKGSILKKLYYKFRLSRYSDKYIKSYHQSMNRYNLTMKKLYEEDISVPVLVLHPNEPFEMPGNIETRPSVIKSKGDLSEELIYCQLNKNFPELFPNSAK